MGIPVVEEGVVGEGVVYGANWRVSNPWRRIGENRSSGGYNKERGEHVMP